MYMTTFFLYIDPQWDRKSVDDHGSTTRVLFRKILMMENFDSCDKHCFYIKLNTVIIYYLYHIGTKYNTFYIIFAYHIIPLKVVYDMMI